MAQTGPSLLSASDLEPLRGLEHRLPTLGRGELGRLLMPFVHRLQEPLPSAQVPEVVDAALSLCRRLYANARSGDALPLARAVLAQSAIARDPALERRAATACGLLSADTADIVGAIEHHVRALRLAAGDPVEMARVWNNIGMAMGIAGNYELAGRCYQRALNLLEGKPDAVVERYAAHGNLAESLFQVGAYEEGLRFGYRALEEQGHDQDRHAALLVRRNVVRLLVALGQFEEAAPHVTEALALADELRTPRALIAAQTARAVHELAIGRTDVALTRLEQALSRAREVPAALRDTLACVIHAEETAAIRSARCCAWASFRTTCTARRSSARASTSSLRACRRGRGPRSTSSRSRRGRGWCRKWLRRISPRAGAHSNAWA